MLKPLPDTPDEASGDDRPPLVKARMPVTLVMSGALLAAAWLLAPSPLPWPWAAGGGAFVLGGIALRMWAAGHLQKSQTLVTWGPFSHLRNPLYVGTLLLGIGFSFLTGRWETLPFTVAAMLIVYVPTVRYEERRLRHWYGDAYEHYLRQVPRWWPRLTPAAPCTERFTWAQVKKNREHRNLLAQAALLAGFMAIHLLRATAQ